MIFQYLCILWLFSTYSGSIKLNGEGGDGSARLILRKAQRPGFRIRILSSHVSKLAKRRVPESLPALKLCVSQGDQLDEIRGMTQLAQPRKANESGPKMFKKQEPALSGKCRGVLKDRCFGWKCSF